jgi:hypothetical protein
MITLCGENVQLLTVMYVARIVTTIIWLMMLLEMQSSHSVEWAGKTIMNCE